MLKLDSYFYLSVNYFTETHALVEDNFWFKAHPMGVHKLNSIMKDMTQAAGISGVTNHSSRKTLVQKLQSSSPSNYPDNRPQTQLVKQLLFSPRKQMEDISHFFLQHPMSLPTTSRLNTSPRQRH